MVFFVCEGCNETLKKNKVDAHAARCRSCWAVSCVDCTTVFEGNDYAAHTSCISEAQKYQKSLYKEKQGKQGHVKQSPQERWMRVVAEAKAEKDPKLQGVLDRVAGYDNVPRKKNKFVNFMKNSIAITDNATVERVWGIYEAAFQATQPQTAVASHADASNGTSKRTRDECEEEASIHDAKKAKGEDAVEEMSSKDRVKLATKLIKAALKKESSGQVELGNLEQQIVEQMMARGCGSLKKKKLEKAVDAALSESGKFDVVKIVRLSEK